MPALVAGTACAACDRFGIARNTATTFDILFWIEVANSDVPLVQSAPNGPDYIDIVIFVLCFHSGSPRKASNTDASQVCLGKPGVCRLGCVEFIYTSVSRVDT